MSELEEKLNIRTARKEHKCDLCGKPIKKGTRYWRKDTYYQGHHSGSHKEHANCVAVMEGKDATE